MFHVLHQFGRTSDFIELSAIEPPINCSKNVFGLGKFSRSTFSSSLSPARRLASATASSSVPSSSTSFTCLAMRPEYNRPPASPSSSFTSMLRPSAALSVNCL